MILLKATLITVIMHLLLFFITRLLMSTMTDEENVIATVKHHFPTRVLVFSALWFISLIVAIFFLIMTIVRW